MAATESALLLILRCCSARNQLSVDLTDDLSTNIAADLRWLLNQQHYFGGEKRLESSGKVSFPLKEYSPIPLHSRFSWIIYNLKCVRHKKELRTKLCINLHSLYQEILSSSALDFVLKVFVVAVLDLVLGR